MEWRIIFALLIPLPAACLPGGREGLGEGSLVAAQKLCQGTRHTSQASGGDGRIDSWLRLCMHSMDKQLDPMPTQPSGHSILDCRFVLLLSCFIILLTSVPYIYGYLSCPDDKHFMGLVGRDVPGGYMYFMWQVQAKEGKNLFQDKLTSEEHEPFYFNPEWWLLGRFLQATGLSLEAGYQTERALTLVAALFIFSYLLSHFFPDIRQRRWILIWMVFTSGLGWIFWLAGPQSSWPIQVWDVQGINFFSYAINKPHYIRSFALVCLGYALLLTGEKKQKNIYFFLAGLSIIGHGIVRPYNLPTALGLCLVFPTYLLMTRTNYTWVQAGRYLITIITALPIFGYYAYLYTATPLQEIWDGVALVPLSPLEMIIWVGVPGIIVLLGLDGVKHLGRKENPVSFLTLWAGLMLMLIYSYPLLEWGMEAAGLCYVLAPVLAGYYLYREFLPWLRTKMRYAGPAVLSGRWVHIVGCALVLVCLPSNIIVFTQMHRDLMEHDRPYYLHQEVVDGLNWLSRNVPRDAVVLSTAGNGFYLPARAGVRAVTGHYDFTIDFARKNSLVKKFFHQQTASSERQKILTDLNVTHVLYTREEQKLGSFNPHQVDFLGSVLTNQRIAIYQVQLENKK